MLRRAIWLIALLALGAAPAMANTPHSIPTSYLQVTEAGFGDTNGVNCAVLSGSPYLCIKNNAAAPIVGVQVVNVGSMFADSGWLPIPGGPIPPQGSTVVKFPTWGSGCGKLLFVKLASGGTHPFQLDVCHASSLTVSGW